VKRKLFLFLLSLVTGLYFSLAVVWAQDDSWEETNFFEVKKDEVVDHDYFAAGENVTISGVVNGDVYAAGATILVEGQINGDLLGTAGVVTILGEIKDDVRVAGGNVLVNGEIGKNLTAAGGNVIITSEAEIGGSLLAFAGSLEARGPIGKEANVYAAQALFANQVGGDLKGSMEELVLTSEAGIGGDLAYQSPQEAQIAEGALISGRTTYQPKEKAELKRFSVGRTARLRPQLHRFSFLTKLFSFLVSLVLGFWYLSWFPKRAQGIDKVLGTRFWGSLGTGLLVLILFLPVVVLVALTIIGLPLLFLLLPLFGFLLYFCRIFPAMFFGKKWMGKSPRRALLAGLLLYYLLKMIPVLDFLTTFVFTTTGLGAFVLDLKSLRQTAKKGRAAKK
jgi:hypothetical protein